MIAEAFLRSAAEEDGGLGVYSPWCVAEFRTSLEVWLSGQHERRGLHPWWSLCHGARRSGSEAHTRAKMRFGSVELHKTRVYSNCVLCFAGDSAGAL